MQAQRALKGKTLPCRQQRCRIHSFQLFISIPAALLLFLFTGSQPVRSAPLAQQPRQFQPGDIVVSLSNGDVLWYDSGGKFLQHLPSKTDGMLGGLAFSSYDKNLYLASLSDDQIRYYDTNGQLIGSFASGLNSAISVVFDINGNMYLGPYMSSPVILRLDRTHTVTGKFGVQANSLQNGAFLFLDLSVDQKTIFYTDGGQAVHRYDVSGTGVQLNDFVVSPVSGTFAAVAPSSYELYGLRLLPPGDGSGGLLVASSNGVLRLDSSGQLIQLYGTESERSQWITLRMDPDGRSFWSTSGTRVYKFDLGSSSPVLVFDAGADTPFSQNNVITGLAIVGEIPAALQFPSPTPTYTPTFTPTPTATFTPTSTPTTTSTGTPTATSTGTPTSAPTVTPTETPTPTTTIIPVPPPPPTPFPGLLLLLLFIAVFSAAAGGAVYLVVHALQPRPQPGDRLGYQHAQVKVQSQADAGEQYVEFSSNQHLPELRLKSDQGDSDYSIDFSGAAT